MDINKNKCRCNFCGRQLDIFDLNEDYSIHKILGYGTEYDGSKIDLNFCCECMNNIISKCAISPISEN